MAGYKIVNRTEPSGDVMFTQPGEERLGVHEDILAKYVRDWSKPL